MGDYRIDRERWTRLSIIEQMVKDKPYQLREVLRAREEFLRLFYDGTFDADADNIERYFTQFAVAARNMREKSR